MDSNKRTPRSFLRLLTVLVLVSASAYYTYQSRQMLPTITETMRIKNVDLSHINNTTYDSDDASSASSGDPEKQSAHDGTADDDETGEAIGAIRKHTVHRISGHTQMKEILPLRTKELKQGLHADSYEHGIYSTDPTPFYNSTHISCFFKSKRGDKQKWYQRVVHISEFWEKESCRFRLGRDTIYFHQGKAGGGTVNYMGTKYHLGLKSDHPFIQEGSVEGLMDGPLTSLIFTVRDPVERFVSMFNWRLLTLCHPGDKRTKTITNEDSETANIPRKKSLMDLRKAKKKRVGGHAENPDKYCLSTRVEQEKTLRVKYNSDPNVMAEALCTDSPNYEQAVRDLTDINHSATIAQWLEFLINPKMSHNITDKGIQNFFAIPLSSNFEYDIESLISEILLNRYGHDILDAMPGQLKRKTENKKKALMHSSVKHSKGKPHQLSPLAQCCLTRYYQKDYYVIQSMLGNEEDAILKPIEGAHPIIEKACDWGDEEQRKSCKDILRSMLKDRGQYLPGKGKEVTCSELIYQ